MTRIKNFLEIAKPLEDLPPLSIDKKNEQIPSLLKG